MKHAPANTAVNKPAVPWSTHSDGVGVRHASFRIQGAAAWSQREKANFLEISQFEKASI